MQSVFRVFLGLVAIVLVTPVAQATGTHAGGHYGFGTPATTAEATITVPVKLTDEMRIVLDLPQVRGNEVVRFVVTNTGASPHEFSIGDSASQRAHAAMMKKMPDMKHENDPTALTLAPGETKELTWRFDKDVKGQIELACQMPGHYDGGMVSKIPFVK
jgi:uncharacterized cupredoxin-like copper-binding protein